MMCALMGTVITFWPKVFFNQSIWHGPGVHPASALRPSVFSPQPIVRASAPASFYAQTPGAKYRIFFYVSARQGGMNPLCMFRGWHAALPRSTWLPDDPSPPPAAVQHSFTRLQCGCGSVLPSDCTHLCLRIAGKTNPGWLFAAAADEQLTPLLPFK